MPFRIGSIGNEADMLLRLCREECLECIDTNTGIFEIIFSMMMREAGEYSDAVSRRARMYCGNVAKI